MFTDGEWPSGREGELSASELGSDVIKPAGLRRRKEPPAFILPPPLDGDWAELPEETTALLAERMYDFGRIKRTTRVQRARAMVLPFYAEQLLVDLQVADRRGPPRLMCCLYGANGVVVLDGNSTVIHNQNANQPFDISDTETREAYLKFFCYFVHGEQGPFEIIEDPSDLEGATAGERVLPTVIEKGAEDAPDTWAATVLYGSTLFRARFEIEDTGMIDMISDEELAEEILRAPLILFNGASRVPGGER